MSQHYYSQQALLHGDLTVMKNNIMNQGINQITIITRIKTKITIIIIIIIIIRTKRK